MNYSDIVNALVDAGIDVAVPGARQGVCTSPYAVVQNTGTYRFAQSAGLGYTLITVHCYVPLYAYDRLSLLIEGVKEALKDLQPDLRPSGGEGVHLINDRFRAHEGSIQYVIMRLLKD